MRRVIEIAFPVLDLRRLRHNGVLGRSPVRAVTFYLPICTACKGSHPVPRHCVRAPVRVKVVLVIGDQGLLGIELLVELRVRLGPLLVVDEEECRYQADQQLCDNNKDDAFPEADVVIQESANEGADESAQRKG